MNIANIKYTSFYWQIIFGSNGIVSQWSGCFGKYTSHIFFPHLTAGLKCPTEYVEVTSIWMYSRLTLLDDIGWHIFIILSLTSPTSCTFIIHSHIISWNFEQVSKVSLEYFNFQALCINWDNLYNSLYTNWSRKIWKYYKQLFCVCPQSFVPNA